MNAAAARPILHGELANNVLGASEDLLKGGVGNHLQPGVVTYDNEDGTKTTYLLELDAIERMRKTAAGKPIVGKAGDFDHVKVQPGKKYDGIAAASFWAGDLGWERIQFMLTNKETAEACRKGYQFSCAYIPTETDGKPGLWHNVPYDEKIIDGEYTHFAVVPNPRYEGATIELFNSKDGGLVNKALKAILAALVPAKQLREIVNSIEDDEKKKAAADAAKAEKKNKVKADFDLAFKNAQTPEEKAKATEAYEKANAEIDDAASGDAPETTAPDANLPPQPLGGGDVTPEPGIPGQAPIQAKPEGAAAAPVNAAPPETPEQAQEREKKAAEVAALEKKNADDAAAKKASEEKAAKEKDETEKKNALEVAKAAAVKEALRVERFNVLRKLADERGGNSGTPFVGIVSATEKENLGRDRYGSRK